MTQVDDPFIAGVHFVIDPHKDRAMVPEIGHLHPDMHGKRITGAGQTVLRKDLIRIRLPALEFVAVITGNAKLHFDSLLGYHLVMAFRHDRITHNARFPPKQRGRQQYSSKKYQ
jgi:hypothetical protein